MPSLTFESRAVGGAGRGGGAAEEKEDMPSRHRTVSNLLSLDQQENRSAIVIENSDGKVLGLTTLMIMMMKKLFMTTDGASLVICVCILNMEWTALARHLPSSSLLSVSCLPSIHASWKSFVRPWEPLCAHQACKTCPPPKKKTMSSSHPFNQRDPPCCFFPFSPSPVLIIVRSIFTWHIHGM